MVMKMTNIKAQIISEIDRRIQELQEHRYDEIIVTGNQYDELNQALAKVIGVPVMKELGSLKNYVEKL